MLIEKSRERFSKAFANSLYVCKSFRGLHPFSFPLLKSFNLLETLWNFSHVHCPYGSWPCIHMHVPVLKQKHSSPQETYKNKVCPAHTPGDGRVPTNCLPLACSFCTVLQSQQHFFRLYKFKMHLLCYIGEEWHKSKNRNKTKRKLKDFKKEQNEAVLPKLNE